MNVTRDVILDLLPLCHAGEASDDSRALVAAYAARDPEVARLLAAAPLTALPETPDELDKETEMKTLERTMSYLKWQTVLLGGATFLTFAVVLVLALVPAILIFAPAGQAAAGWLLPTALVAVLAAGLAAAAAWSGYFMFRSFYRADGG
jgi:hypothetical protein